MLEKQFQMIFKRSLSFYCQEKGIERYKYHKYKDTGIWQTPYDCHFRLPGSRYYSFELKVNRLKNTFNFKDLFKNRYHEIMNLRLDEELGDTGRVIIAHRQGSKYRAYAIAPIIADALYHKGSVKTDELEEFSIPIDRIKNHTTGELLYDVTPLIDE